MNQYTIFALACLIGSGFAAVANLGVPGNNCYSDSNCVTNAYCQTPSPCYEGTCVCLAGYTSWVDDTNDDGGCSTINLVGASCSTTGTDDAGGCIGNSVCTTGTCSCPTGTTADTDNTWCTGDLDLTGDCSTSGDTGCKVYTDYMKTYKDDAVNSALASVKAEQVCTSNVCTCNAAAGYFDVSGTCTQSIANEGQDCVTATGPVCDPMVLDADGNTGGLECDGTTNKCTCSTATTAVRSYTSMGIVTGICAHASATFDLAEGHECRESTTTPEDNNYCISPLTCDICPGDNTIMVSVCRTSGASGLIGSLISVFLAIVFSKYL